MSLSGGIDVGGTKIEAALFDQAYERITHRRLPTPRSDYSELLDAIESQARWLRDEAGEEIPLGVGLPGFMNPKTGAANTANLPASGKPLKRDLENRISGVTVGHDLKCFALSEANGGAGDGYNRVFGLILGTGLGGAFCRNGSVLVGRQGLAGEIGHIPISTARLSVDELPVIRCGCGLDGCLETLVAGPGLSRLSELVSGESRVPADIVSAEAAGDPGAAKVMDLWLDLASQALQAIQLAYDPDCVVVGGGLSRMENIAVRLAERFAQHRMTRSEQFEIMPARFGDSSGTRGAAILARRANS